MAAEIIDLEDFRLRRAAQADCDEAILPWSSQHWPLCRIRHFVRATPSGRPPRCCCGRVYNEATLRTRASLLTAIVRETLGELKRRGKVTLSGLVAAVMARPELTSVERAALSTGPCATCPIVSEQTQQLRFLWGLYRAYWGRATNPSLARSHQGELTARQSRQSAIDLRRHIRQEIALIRHLQRQLALCPWARSRQITHISNPSRGC